MDGDGCCPGVGQRREQDDRAGVRALQSVGERDPRLADGGHEAPVLVGKPAELERPDRAVIVGSLELLRRLAGSLWVRALVSAGLLAAVATQIDFGTIRGRISGGSWLSRGRVR